MNTGLKLLYLDLLWLEYLDCQESARKELIFNNKLGAIGWAISAYKAKSKYENELGKFILGI
jgi:hypothetical protein